MKKIFFISLIILIPTVSAALENITITSREIVEKLATIESKFETVYEKIDAVERKINQKIAAVDQKINQKINATYKRIDIVDQKIDKKINTVNQKLIFIKTRIDDLQYYEYKNQRFVIFQWTIGLLVLIFLGIFGYIMRRMNKMQNEMQNEIDTLPEKIFLMFEERGYIDKIQKSTSQEVQNQEESAELYNIVNKLTKTVDILKDNLNHVINHLKEKSNFSMLAPHPAL